MLSALKIDLKKNEVEALEIAVTNNKNYNITSMELEIIY